jgi:hypothetical protein
VDQVAGQPAHERVVREQILGVFAFAGSRHASCNVPARRRTGSAASRSAGLRPAKQGPSASGYRISMHPCQLNGPFCAFGPSTVKL